MSLLTRMRVGAATVGLALALALPAAHAQDITESHMKAARAAVAAINATGAYDNILAQTALALKDQLIQQSPDQQDLIEKTVNDKAFAMVSRRADLEKEAATSFAKLFTEEDLNAIATFYNSAPGKKLLADGPVVTREIDQAAGIWQRGIARDLAVEVAKVVAPVANASPVVTPDGTAPAPGAAPADPAAQPAPQQ